MKLFKNMVLHFSLATMSSVTLAECQNANFTGNESTIMNAYIAFYGRPADAEGLQYWSGRLEEEGGLNAVIDAFGNSAEFEDRFGSLDNTALVTNIYQQLFNRAPDEGGLAYYVGELDSGRKTLQSIALNVLYGAQNEDEEKLLNKRLVTDSYYVESQASGNSLTSVQLADILAPVSENYSTAEAACENVSVLLIEDYAPTDERAYGQNIGDASNVLSLDAGFVDLANTSATLVEGYVGYGFDSADVFRIITSLDVSLSISLSNLEADIDLAVYSESGDVLWTGDNSGLESEIYLGSALAGFSGYLAIYPFQSSASPYTLSILSVPLNNNANSFLEHPSGNIGVYSADSFSSDITYLGCWTCGDFDSQAIANDFGTYGSEFNSLSIRNDFGTYGSNFSANSACNEFGSNPPYLYDSNLNYFGELSSNQFRTDSICNNVGVYYNSGSCTLLESYCE